MTSRKRLIIIICAVVPIGIILTFFVISRMEYSMLEIDGDNYNDKIKPNLHSIQNDVNFDECIPDRFELSLAFLRGEGENNSCITTRKKSEFDNKREYVSFESKVTGLTYSTGWQDGRFVICNIINPNQDENMFALMKRILDKLILTQGFVLKESKLKNGRDLLIKENDSDFIIVQGFSYSQRAIYSLFITTYSKKKYFTTRVD